MHLASIVLAATGFSLLLWGGWSLVLRWRRLRKLGVCMWCGYARAGIRSDVCPECGRPPATGTRWRAAFPSGPILRLIVGSSIVAATVMLWTGDWPLVVPSKPLLWIGLNLDVKELSDPALGEIWARIRDSSLADSKWLDNSLLKAIADPNSPEQASRAIATLDMAFAVATMSEAETGFHKLARRMDDPTLVAAIADRLRASPTEAALSDDERFRLFNLAIYLTASRRDLVSPAFVALNHPSTFVVRVVAIRLLDRVAIQTGYPNRPPPSQLLQLPPERFALAARMLQSINATSAVEVRCDRLAGFLAETDEHERVLIRYASQLAWGDEEWYKQCVESKLRPTDDD